jgi:phenylpropionate dioxygenase-like ring-hydroxylating dioxygenase large terminal subunit
MTSARSSRGAAAAMPVNCWYAVAPAASISPGPVPLRAVGRPVVLFRTADGALAALEDRCAHRAFPLSAGRLDGDLIRCGLCGFSYDAAGACVSVPTQPRVPFGAVVPAFPARESDGLAWIWLGEPGRAGLHRIPDLPWLAGPGWATVSGDEHVDAGFLLLHENFADVTQVRFVAPDLAPAVLGAAPPPLRVTVSETTVALHREYPPGPLPTWQAEMLGRPAGEPLAHVQEGFFFSPAVWVDYWDVRSPAGDWFRLRFTHLVTPVTETSSTVLWRVSRDFAVTDEAATGRLAGMFSEYYDRVLTAMRTAQRVLDTDGPGAEVNVSADVAALKVREIVHEMLAEERPAAARPAGERTRRSRA